MPVLLVAVMLAASSPAHASQQPDASLIEPGAGTWKTWVLASGAAVRPAPPPDQGPTQTELAQLHDLESQRDAAALDQIAYWDTADPAYRWNQMAETRFSQLTAPAGQRGMALLSVAIYDATIATWDAKFAYTRSHPSDADPTLHPVLANPATWSYPSERAVVAGAASSILAYLFPDDQAALTSAAEQAGQSRLLAGVEYPSDVAAGLALGRSVAARTIDWANSDGSAAVWDGTMPNTPGHWTPDPGTQPVGPLAGTWKTWVLTSGNQLRPGPPPAFDSGEESAQLAQVRDFSRTFASNYVAFKWSPQSVVDWMDQVRQSVFEYRLDNDPPMASRAYALLAVAGYDAMVACFDAKYTYWAPRPYQLDPNLTTVLPHYPHPSYPSAHACTAGAVTEVESALFPRDARSFAAQAQELADSRWQAGIHFPIDTSVGLELGRSVGQLVVARSRTDGAGSQ
ncbi:MAG: vanadium-dependent haloperoxidase [Chloroflexi bacterium]|nr:vanadium-dependent haloperoxidase [Chloroflexota bacterium]